MSEVAQQSEEVTEEPTKEPAEEVSEDQSIEKDQKETEEKITESSSTQTEAPFFIAINRVKSTTSKIIENANKVYQETEESQKDKNTPEELNILITPFAAIGDIIDSTIVNTGRRTIETLGPIGSEARAIYRTFTRPILHPLDTLNHPLKYIANPTRMITAIGNEIRAILNTPTKGFSELVNKGIRNPLERVGYKIPIVGEVFGLVGKTIGWGARIPKKIMQKATNWIKTVDDLVKAQQ